MSYVRIWVHLVFATKNRDPLILKECRSSIHRHIMANCKEKGIYLDSINGYVEHIHCLISLGKEQIVSQIVRLIKGESSYWINKMGLTPSKFNWQDDYFAVSVSESQVEVVRNYIRNQEKHHSGRSFTEEVDEFMNKYGFQQISESE